MRVIREQLVEVDVAPKLVLLKCMSDFIGYLPASAST